jgi:hypothetical protein
MARWTMLPTGYASPLRPASVGGLDIRRPKCRAPVLRSRRRPQRTPRLLGIDALTVVSKRIYACQTRELGAYSFA